MAVITKLNKPGYHFIFCIMITGFFCNTGLAQDVKTQNNTVEPVNIEITTHLGDQQSFVEHDVISFFISLDKAAYLYGFYQDASGHVFQLMPGKAQPEHYFQPGFYIPFPPQDSTFQFVVQAPFGKEQLWMFASEQGRLEFKGKNTGQGIKQLELNYQELTDYIRAASRQQFGRASLLIHTRSR